MRLHSLTVKNARGIRTAQVSFGDRITIVSGRNETGKSTLIEVFDELIATKSTSKKQGIRDLQPVGKDVGPEVTAEFTISGRRVRYRKRWLVAPLTELEFLDGEEAALTGDTAHERAAELWEQMDTTLWEASRILQGVAITNSQLDESAALRAALDAQAGHGSAEDDAGDTIVDRVRMRTDEFWTDRRAGLNAATKAKRESYEAAREEAQRAKAAVEDLEKLVAACDVAEEEADASRDKVAEQAEIVARLTEETAQARSAEEALMSAATTLEAAEREAGTATRLHAERVNLAKALSDAEKEIAEVDEELTAARAKLTECTEASSGAKAEAKRLDTARREAASALERARKAERRAQRLRARDELATLIGRADELDEQIAKLEAVEAALTEEQAKRLESLESELSIERSVAKREAASVTLTAIADSDIVVDGEELSLKAEDREYRHVLADMAIDIPGSLRIELNPGASKHAETMERLEADLADLLAEIGADDTDHARRLRTADEARAKKIADRRLTRDGLFLSRDETADREELRALREADLGEEDSEENTEEPDIEALEKADAEAAAAAQAASARSEDRSEAAVLAERDVAVLDDRRTGRERIRAQRADELAEARKAHGDDELAAAMEKRRAELAEAEAEHDRAEAAFAKAGGAGAIDELENAQTKLEGLQSIDREAQTILAINRSKLADAEALNVQETFEAATAQLAAAERIWRSTDLQARAARLLEEVLLDKRAQARARYVAPLRTRLEELGRRAMRNESFGVEIDETLTVAARSLDGVSVPFDQLSTGAQEQLAILIRMAVASLVGGDDGVPIMLDDTLGHSDAQRLEQVTGLLGKARDIGQIIILTANEDRFAMIPDAKRVRL